MKYREIVKLVDEAVTLDQQIKSLEKQLKDKKEEIISLGEGAHTGKNGSVSVTLQERNIFKSEKAKIFMTKDQFDSCYESSKSITCRFTVFNKE